MIEVIATIALLCAGYDSMPTEIQCQKKLLKCVVDAPTRYLDDKLKMCVLNGEG